MVWAVFGSSMYAYCTRASVGRPCPGSLVGVSGLSSNVFPPLVDDEGRAKDATQGQGAGARRTRMIIAGWKPLSMA